MAGAREDHPLAMRVLRDAQRVVERMAFRQPRIDARPRFAEVSRFEEVRIRQGAEGGLGVVPVASCRLFESGGYHPLPLLVPPQSASFVARDGAIGGTTEP